MLFFIATERPLVFFIFVLPPFLVTGEMNVRGIEFS